jgi:hypothetical protein
MFMATSIVVVQTGDQLDRGDDEQAILDLLERLARDASASGGAVHVLNGNHEIMNARLDLRYVTDGGFLDFEDAVVIDVVDSTLADYPSDQQARVAAFRPGGQYAHVLARRNLVAIVGDNVFAHGGVLPEHVDYGLERMNAEGRAWLLGESPAPEWLDERESVFWSRLYSDEPDAEGCEVLAAVLERLGASRMIVGHTVQDGGITSYCDGLVWCIDVGLSAHYGGDVEVLEIAGDAVRAIREEAAASTLH